jgi:hypothetical protein
MISIVGHLGSKVQQTGYKRRANFATDQEKDQENQKWNSIPLDVKGE